MHEAPHAVLIDTDIGDDVDDAFGLALAAVHPALRVCGVTTVCGPTKERAQLAAMIIAAAGQPHVPVAPGSSAMSDGCPGSARFSHQPLLDLADGSARMIDARNTRSAYDLILECSHQTPTLTLIALGPLTNIAAALQHDPTLPQRARLIAMAGKLGLPYPDWNLRCDPAAARVVLASGMPITLVGMHLTMRCKLWPAQMAHLFANPRPLAVLLARCILAWRTRKRRMPILHDALTVAVAADPTIITSAWRSVRILPWGFSIAGWCEPPNALVGMQVNLERFHAMLDQHLLGAPSARSAPHGLVERLAHMIA